MRRIDLNVDIGEGFPWDEELLEYATSANVCCGAHAGSLELTVATVERCLGAGVRVGAHPGYPDREGFGRRGFEVLDGAVQEVFVEGWESQFAGFGGGLRYVKPHGAFYNESARGGKVGVLLEGMLRAKGVGLMGLPGSEHEEIARRAGVGFIREGFADRRYTEDGLLMARTVPGAVLHSLEEKVGQALWLAERVDSICLHGDEEDCVSVIRAVRGALEAEGWEVNAGEA